MSSAYAGFSTFKDSAIVVGPTVKALEMLKTMSNKEVQTLVGRKLSFKEKVSLFILKKTKISTLKVDGEENVRTKKGKAALILGISAFALIFIPIIGLLSVPAAVLAIIFGAQASRDNKNDKQGQAGKILGIVFLGLFVLLVLAALAFLAAYGW
jgi:hypothetical protein